MLTDPFSLPPADAAPSRAANLDALLDRQLDITLAESPAQLAAALRLAAIPTSVNAELLATLRANDDGHDAEIIAWLSEFPFVQTINDEVTYTRTVRRLLLERWRADEEGFITAHRRAAAHFERKLAATENSSLVLNEYLAQRRLYHLLVAEPAEGLIYFDTLFQEARSERRFAALELYLSIMEEQRSWLASDTDLWLAYYRALLAETEGQWAASGQQFEALLAREGVTDALAALALRGLGRALINQENWVRAIDLHQSALAISQSLGDKPGMAGAMMDLGYAYMDLAQRAWGGGEPPPLVRRTLLERLVEATDFITRIPLLVYLSLRWGFRTLLPALTRVGRGIDWVVARLFGDAAMWLRRAELTYREAGNLSGASAAQEYQANVFLALNHPRQAEQIYRTLLESAGAGFGAYRMARVRMGLAEALLRQGQAGQAGTLLDQALPVFVEVQHKQRIAESLSLAGQASVMRGDMDAAAGQYAAAVAAWQQTGESEALTATAAQVEMLAARRDLSSAARDRLLDAANSVVARRYEERYVHPLMRAFQLGALALLAALLFLVPLLAVRTDRGNEIGAGTPLMEPLAASENDEFGPALELTIDQQIQPRFQVQVVGAVVGWAILGYILVYLAAGVYMIRRASATEIQEGQEADVYLDHDTIASRDGAEHRVHSLAWPEVKWAVVADQKLVRQPIGRLSGTALFGEQESVQVKGSIRYYDNLQRHVLSRIEQLHAPIYDVSSVILRSKMGLLFVVSLAYLVGFGVLTSVASNVAVTPLPLEQYTLADIYGLAFIGLTLPLAWWFAVQPLRARYLVKPHTILPWLTLALGLLLTLLALMRIQFWRFSLPRPDIAVGVIAALLIGVSATHIYRARWLPGQRPGKSVGQHIYSPLVRYATVGLAVLLIGASFLSIGREVLSFHYLVVGNHLQREAAAEQDRETRLDIYRRGLEAYDRSLALRQTATTFNNRGVMLAQSERFDEAIQSYNAALQSDPNQPVYISNVGLAYSQEAVKAARGLDRVPYYQAALATFSTLIEDLEAAPDANYKGLLTAHLLRGGTRYELAELYQDQNQIQDALPIYEEARTDFQWVIEHARWQDVSDRAAAYAGLGWARLMGRQQYDKNTALAARQAEIDRALDDFNTALYLAKDNPAAWTGRGWSHYFTASEHPARCTGANTTEDGLTFAEQIRFAIDDFSRLITLQPNSGIHYRTRAQLQYILGNCPDWKETPADPAAELKRIKRQQLDASIQDYKDALERKKEVPAWWRRLATIENEAGYYDKAIEDYNEALRLDSEQGAWWLELVELIDKTTAKSGSQYLARGREAAAEATRLVPKDDRSWNWLGWMSYLTDDYPAALDAYPRAIKLAPYEPRYHFNLGLAYAASGDSRATAAYEQGIAAADLATPATRKRRLAEALGDLQGLKAGPANLKSGLVDTLKSAAARKPALNRCRVIAPGGLPLLAGPAADRPATAAPRPVNTLLIPIGRSEDGKWLRVEDVATKELGWVANNAQTLVCNVDLKTRPVLSGD
jgi:tetratricopeptide (TPR) repeat protein